MFSLAVSLPSLQRHVDANDLASFLSSAKSTRSLVFFDESLVGYAIYSHTNKTQTHLPDPYLNVSVVPSSELDSFDPEKSAELAIHTQSIPSSNIVFSTDSHTVWRFQLPVAYPRRKFADPVAVFSCYLDTAAPAAASAAPLSLPVSLVPLSDFLPPHRPSPLLQPATANTTTVLPPPTTIGTTALTASLSVPISVSLVIKLKLTKPAGRNNILLATLSIDSSDDLVRSAPPSYSFHVLDLAMDFRHGSIDHYECEVFPNTYSLSDSLSLTYKLVNNDFLDQKFTLNDSANSKPLGIKLALQLLENGEPVSHTITTNWTPVLDFGIVAPPINNSLKSSTNYSHSQLQPKYGDTRKSALFNSIKSRSTTALRPVSSLSSSSVTVNLTTNTNSTLSGLKLTFIGRLNVHMGEIVNWRLHAINNSPNKLNLSLIVQNPINFNPVYSGNTNNSASNLVTSDMVIHNRLQLYLLYSSLKLESTGVIILTNDVRLGPIEPNAVFETDIDLVGLSKGIFNLNGIKIFDTISGDGIDFGKLVEVFVV